MKLCVLGSNISYTLSPKLHQAIFDILGESGSYTVTDVLPEQLEATVEKLIGEYDGFNVTKPFKESVAKLLDCNSPVNTVKCKDKSCTSTDPEGFYGDYVSAFGEPQGNILILGAGGAAKSVAYSLQRSAAKVFVYNRSYERAQQLSEYGAVALKTPEGKFDSVINCTSLGLHGEQAMPAGLDLSGVKFAYDLIYSSPTPFLATACEHGATVKGGLGMLIRQAIASHEFWRGCKFGTQDKNNMTLEIAKILLSKQN